MKPLNRDFWWMIFLLLFATGQTIRLFLRPFETSEERFSRFMIILWIILTTGMAISRFYRWRNAVHKRIKNSVVND